ncbi:MAG: hypothetical protein CVU90_06385 [Firmicutes bacterium HGW-Firmicutes-15]|nr:MAG: hypothetical protein CVU90_06385 [Firmicutes bacterium HGW-Firmicutes-15]
MNRLKGLVIEAGDNWALILSEQGQYKKIKTKNLLQVGEIWQEPTGYAIRYAVAAAVLLVFLGAAFSILPVVAYAQVSSGVELGLNRWEWVVSARPLNDEGRMLLQEVNLRGKTLDQAVELIVDNTLINSNPENKEIVLNVVTTKPGNEQNRQRIMEKMDTKVKQILDQDKLKANMDKKKGYSSSENKNSNDEVETNKIIPSNKNDRFSGDQYADETKGIKAQERQQKSIKEKDIDEEKSPNIYNEQNIYKKDSTREMNTEQNPRDIQGDEDKTKDEERNKPEKETGKSLEKNVNAEGSAGQSNGRDRVKQ